MLKHDCNEAEAEIKRLNQILAEVSTISTDVLVTISLGVPALLQAGHLMSAITNIRAMVLLPTEGDSVN